MSCDHHIHLEIIAGRSILRQADKQADRQADTQGCRQGDKQADRQVDKQADRQAERRAYRHAEKQAHRQSERQADRQADGQVDRKANRQADMLQCLIYNLQWPNMPGGAATAVGHAPFAARLALRDPRQSLVLRTGPMIRLRRR